jgi:hypothetical protein
MNKIYWLFLMVSAGFLLTQCRNDLLVNSTNNSNAGYFPNGVGSYWKYQRYDSIGHTSDIVTVRIRSTVLKERKTYSVWTYEKACTVFDSVLVYTSQDSVVMIDSQMLYGKKVILIPYTVSSKWNSTGIMGDTSLVTGQEISGNIGTYKIVRRIFGIDVSLNDDEWLAPYVGMVKATMKEFSVVRQVNESLELVDYSVR